MYLPYHKAVNLYLSDFRRRLEHWFHQRGRVSVIHFRSIFEGYWLANNKERLCDRLIYEVNGLPSIELKYRYPAVADDVELLVKLRNQEEHCLQAADQLITEWSRQRKRQLGMEQR